MRTLCFGEVLVDLVCEHPVDSPSQADAFVPQFGGDVANAAVTAARAGAEVALAGARRRRRVGRVAARSPRAGGRGARLVPLLDGVRTPIAFVTVDSAGEPTYGFYGDSAAVGRAPVRCASTPATRCSSRSNSLLDERERSSP